MQNSFKRTIKKKKKRRGKNNDCNRKVNAEFDKNVRKSKGEFTLSALTHFKLREEKRKKKNCESIQQPYTLSIRCDLVSFFFLIFLSLSLFFFFF